MSGHLVLLQKHISTDIPQLTHVDNVKFHINFHMNKMHLWRNEQVYIPLSLNPMVKWRQMLYKTATVDIKVKIPLKLKMVNRECQSTAINFYQDVPKGHDCDLEG